MEVLSLNMYSSYRFSWFNSYNKKNNSIEKFTFKTMIMYYKIILYYLEDLTDEIQK